MTGRYIRIRTLLNVDHDSKYALYNIELNFTDVIDTKLREKILPLNEIAFIFLSVSCNYIE